MLYLMPLTSWLRHALGFMIDTLVISAPSITAMPASLPPMQVADGPVQGPCQERAQR